METHLKVATTLLVGHPTTNDVNGDFVASQTSSRDVFDNHISLTRTFSLSLKLPEDLKVWKGKRGGKAATGEGWGERRRE